MKKILLLFCSLSFSLMIKAQTQDFAFCSTPGSLSTELTASEKSSVTDLTVTGSINALDFKFLRDNMPLLSTLDISNTTIVSYSGYMGTSIEGNIITYPNNTIPDDAFMNKSTLTSITLPSTITSIGDGAFFNCTKLSSITVPASVTTIGGSAFSNCSKLYDVSFSSPSSLTSIGNYAFKKCSTIIYFSIPSTVNFIGEYAFSECSGLYYAITIPSSVTEINTNTFYGCTYLSSISIPASVTTIDEDAFANCSALLTVDANNPNYSSINGVLFDKSQTSLIQCPTSITGRYVIPSTVTTLSIPNDYYGAFYGCKNLTSIVIPSSVTTINNNQTFGNCSGLKTLYASASYPISISSLGTFDGASTSTCILHVPYGSKNAYSKSAPWSYFSNIVEASVWNGTGTYSNMANWSSASVPASGADIVIASGELTIDQSVDINNLTINPGAKVTLQSWWNSITASGNLTIQSNSTGTGSFVNNGGTVTVSGTTTVQQYINGAGSTTPNGRYWYVSSPVKGATSTTFDATGANVLKKYDEIAHAWSEITDNTTVLPVGTGYFTRLAADQTVRFTGTLNSGNITLSPTRSGTTDAKRGFNLVGNPYPSYLDWEAATKTNLETTMWYRTYNGSAMVFDTYNATSHEGTNNNLGGAVTRYIPPMQAFWVRVDADGNTGTLGFTNSMRSHQSGNSLKADATNDVIRLKVDNGTNSDETILVFNADAQNDLDAFDSEKMFADNVNIPEIYTSVGSEKLVINGLESVNANQEIALGFKTAKAGSYTISANEINGIDGVVLKDKLLNKTQDLSAASYLFSSDSTNNISRFAISLKANTETTEVNDVLASSIAIVAQNHSIVVTTTESESIITVYDLLGRLVDSKTIAGTSTVIASPNGVFFVKVQTAKNVETKKVVIE